MITVTLDSSGLTAAKIRKLVDTKVAEVTEQVALKTYNYIIGFSDWPYWSGSYISSWTVGVGSPDTSFNEPAERTTRGPSVQYAVPGLMYSLPIKNQPYEKIFISNYTPHAHLVEYEGTKTNDYAPWLTATIARDRVVQMSKLF